MNKNLIIILCILCLILSFLFLNGCKSKDEKLREQLIETQNAEIWELVDQGKIEQARGKAQKYYGDNEFSLQVINNSIDDYIKINKNLDAICEKSEFKLLIQEDWISTIKDGYIYINGSVTNTGDKIIDYYKITVKYLDENQNVVHSNYTNSIEKLYPNESREFEIMNKYNGYDYTRLVIEEVRYE